MRNWNLSRLETLIHFGSPILKMNGYSSLNQMC